MYNRLQGLDANGQHVTNRRTYTAPKLSAQTIMNERFKLGNAPTFMKIKKLLKQILLIKQRVHDFGSCSELFQFNNQKDDKKKNNTKSLQVDSCVKIAQSNNQNYL